MSSQANDQMDNQSSSHQFDFNFRKNKRAFTTVAQLAQKEFIKNQMDEDDEEDQEENLYENDMFLKRTFTDIGAKLYKSYSSLLLADEEKMKEFDANKIMSSYLNNGLKYEQDYLDERDYHFGDLILEFPNPDYQKSFNYMEKGKKKQKKDKKENEQEEKESTFDQSRLDTDNDADQKQHNQKEEKSTSVKRVSLNQARDDFKKAFSMVDASLRSDVSENKIFQITYENAFKKLSHYPDSKMQLKQDDQDSNFNDSNFDEDNEQGKQKNREEETDTLSMLKSLLFNKKQDTQKLLTKRLTKKTNHLINQQQQLIPNIEKLEKQLEEYEDQMNPQKNNISQEELEQDAPLNAKHQQQPQKNQKSENIRKIMKGGKFFKLSDDKKAFERTQNQTKDYLTLVRHATWIRLVKHGFKLRHFISQNGKSIFTVCYGTDENLKITAEKEKLSKALNLEFSDLLSLEPVDSTLRPLRMNTRLRTSAGGQNDQEDEVEDGDGQKEKISGYLRHIRYDIQKLLQIIDYKKIARETNISKLNIEIINEKAVEIKKDQNLSNYQWELYFQYLNQVAEKVTEIRRQYKFSKSDIRAQKINEIIEFQKFQHPIQDIINRFINKDENLKSENRTLMSEDSFTALKIGAGEDTVERQENTLGINENHEIERVFIDFKEFRDIKSVKKKGASLKEQEKEIARQRQSDMKAMKKLYKKHRLLQSIMEIRSRRIRYLMVDLVNDPTLLRKRYEQIEREVKEHEDKYSVLREILCLRQSKLLHVKYIKLYQHQILAHKYREVFTKALDVVNYPNHFHKNLKNLWDFMDMQPQEAYVNYFRTPKNVSFKKKQKLNQIWKNYEVTQNGRVSQFSNMERLKLVNLTVQKAVNLFYLQEKMYIKQYFFLNDRYDLYGNTYKYIFEGCPLYEKESRKIMAVKNLRNFFIQTDQTEAKQFGGNGQIEVQALLEKQISESMNVSKMGQLDLKTGNALSKSKQLSQMDTPSPSIIPSPGPGRRKGKPLINIASLDKVERLFVQKKIKNLEFEWSFQTSTPWYIPYVFIRDYYGEKVALYFSFLGYYTKSLMIIGILGLGVFIIQQLKFFDDPANNNYLNMGFGCLKIFWTSTTLYDWKRKEKLFASQFGQLHDKKDDEDKNVEDEERPGFDGIYMRSLITDNLNSIYYPKFKRFLKISLTLLTCILMLSLYFAFVAAIFVVPTLLEHYKSEAPFLSQDTYKVIIPGILNVLLYTTFNNAIYGSFSTVLTNFENHKSFIEYENNYVAKKYIFSFISLTGPLPILESKYKNYTKRREQAKIVAALNDPAFKTDQNSNPQKGDKVNTNMEMIRQKSNETPKDRALLDQDSLMNDEFTLTQNEQMDANVESKKFNDIISKIKISRLFNDDIYIKFDPSQKLISNSYLKKNPYTILNMYIQFESDKEQYSESADIYGTVDEYLEICIQFSLLTMFGMMFPLSFSIAFIWNIIELLTDKQKLIKYTQRPIPLGEGTIGSWLNLMDLASYMSILTNSGLITFLQSQIILGDMPYRIQNLIKRQDYIVRSTVEVFKKTSNPDPDAKQNQGQDEDEDQNKKKQFNVKKIEIEQKQVVEISEEEEQKILKLRHMQTAKFESRPIFKIYNTIIKPKEQSELHDSMDQSFEILSSDDENIVEKKKKIKEQTNKKQDIIGVDRNTGAPMIWMKYKYYCHQGVILRPILLKQYLVQQVQETSNANLFSISSYLKYVKNISNAKQLAEKEHKYNRKIQIFNMAGIWGDQFRIVDNYKSTEQILEFLFRLRNQDLNHEKNNLYDKIDVNINLITHKDIDKYFVPRGPRFQYSESFLRSSIYYKLLNSMQTINMKKLIIQKSPSEVLQTPYFEEKLYQERIVWDLIKQRFIIDTYLPFSLNQVPELETAIPTTLFPLLQNWKIQKNKTEEILSFQIIKYEEMVGAPIFLLEETELILRGLSKQIFTSGQFGYYIESMFNFLSRDQCYVVRIFNEKYIGSLQDAVSMRRKGKLIFPYSEKELLGFLLLWLKNLQSFEDECQLYHSNINPSTLVLTMSSNNEYKMLRLISDDDVMFLAPELITKFLSSKQIDNSKHIDMYSADVFSICMVLLYMATLGDSVSELTKIKDQQLHITPATAVNLQKKQNDSLNSSNTSMSDVTKSNVSKKSDSQANTLTNNYNTKDKKNLTLLNSSNFSMSIANKVDQKFMKYKDVKENTFDSHLSEGQNVIRIIETYLNSEKAAVMREMYPLLFSVLKSIILQPNPNLRPSKETLMGMIKDNQIQKFYEDQRITRQCYQEFQQLCKSNLEQEKRNSQVVPYNVYFKALVYNKLSLFSKTIDILSHYQFKIDNSQSFEETRRQIDSQLQLTIGYIGCYEIEPALSQLDTIMEQISNKQSGNIGFGQISDNIFKTQTSPISRNQMTSKFYQIDPRVQLSAEQRDDLNRLQNYSLYLKAYSQFLVMDLNSLEYNTKNETIFEGSLRILNIISQNIVNDDTKNKNTVEDITGYLQATLLKLRLLIDAGQEKLFAQTFNKTFNQLISMKQKLSKLDINKIVIDQFYFELVILESESYLSLSRYAHAQKILQDYSLNTIRFKRISEFKDVYLDNNIKVLKDQIIFYTLVSDLSITNENSDGYQYSYQYVKRNFFGMITNTSFTFCFFYDLLEQLFHLIDLDSLKYDILQKMEKCLQFVYLNQYVPEKLDSSLNSFFDIKQSEELLFNPYIQFLIGKTFVGMDSPQDREKGYLFLYRAYKMLRFEVDDNSKKVFFTQEDELKMERQNSLVIVNDLMKSNGSMIIQNQRDKSIVNTSMPQNSDGSQPQSTIVAGKFSLKYNEEFLKFVGQQRMSMMTKSYFFQQRVIENILYCFDMDQDSDQMHIIDCFNYLYRLRPQRKITSFYLSSMDIDKKKKEFEKFKLDKKNRTKDVLAEHCESIRIEAAYVHQYVEFIRKAKLYIQFKKYDYAIIQLKILNNLIQLYLKNYEKDKKKQLRKIMKNKKTEQLLNDDKNIEDIPFFQEKKESTIRLHNDLIFIHNLMAFCQYGLGDFKMAKIQIFKLFKSENLDFLGPNYTIMRNIKGCVLIALDYRQMGIFQSSLMLIEIIDKVLQKVGHYPSVTKTRIVQDLQVLKNIVLFEASQLELYYGFDEFKETMMKKQMQDEDEKSLGNIQEEKEQEEEAFFDVEKIKKLKSRPSIRSQSEFTFQEQINQEQFNKFQMRGFFLHKQSQSLSSLLNNKHVQEFKIQAIEMTFFLSVILQELGRYGKSYIQYKKVIEFNQNEFLEKNSNNISQFQFLYEKEEVRHIKIHFTYSQVLISMHMYKKAQFTLTNLMTYCQDLLKLKKEQKQNENPYYIQTYNSIEELMILMKAFLFIVNCKLGNTKNQKKDLADLVQINTQLLKNRKNNESTFLLLQISYNYLANSIYHMSQIQYIQALESIRSSLKIINKLMGQHKKKVQVNDFKTKISLKTLYEINDNDLESQEEMVEQEQKNFESTKKIDPKLGKDLQTSNIFENLISMDSLRCSLELLELELEQNIFCNEELYDLYYKQKELMNSIRIRKGDQSWFYYKILMIKVQILLRLLSQEESTSIYGLIEHQKKEKIEKIQNFTNQVYSIFGFNVSGNENSQTQLNEREIMKKPLVQQLMKRYYSEQIDKEEEGFGLQGMINVIVKQFSNETEQKDKTLTTQDCQTFIMNDLSHCEELLKKIYSTNIDINFALNEDFAFLNMIQGEFLLQMKDLLGSRKKYKESLKIFKISHSLIVNPNVAIIYSKMAKMQDQIVQLIHQNIEDILDLEISSVLGRVNAELLEFSIKRMIIMDEQVYTAFYEYQINKIVIFLIDSLTNIREQFLKNEINDQMQLLVHFEKNKQKQEMENQVNRVSNICRDILEQILNDKLGGKNIIAKEHIASDIYSKAQIEIIQTRRSIQGINVQYMQKDSEVQFENKKIKYLRLALMILKQLNCSHTDFFKTVENDYMNALENNLDNREEVDYLQYDIDYTIKEQAIKRRKLFGLKNNQDDKQNEDKSDNEGSESMNSNEISQSGLYIQNSDQKQRDSINEQNDNKRMFNARKS